MQLPLLSHQLPLRIFQIISLSSAASATVIIDQATCTASGKSMIVTSALNEAFAMASNVASFTGVRERPTDYLLHSLLGMGTQYFSTAFSKSNTFVSLDHRSLSERIRILDHSVV